MPRKIIRIAWVVLPLALALVGIEIGCVSLVSQTEPVISIALIVCGLVIVGVMARAALRIR